MVQTRKSFLDKGIYVISYRQPSKKYYMDLTYRQHQSLSPELLFLFIT